MCTFYQWRMEKFLKGGEGRKTMYQRRHRLSQMHTTNYMPFIREKATYFKKNLSPSAPSELRAAAADILLTPPPPIVTDRRAAAAAADRMSASRRRRFRDVFTSCCTPAT